MMMIVLLYVVIVVIGFVFGVTVRGIIEKESIQIGTLRAGGFTKWELLLHYIKLSVFVTVLAAIVGNILGYTFMKSGCVAIVRRAETNVPEGLVGSFVKSDTRLPAGMAISAATLAPVFRH